MAARIVELSRIIERAALPVALPAERTLDAAAATHFWRGASGRRYMHSVYSLIECPPLPKTAYMLVRKDGTTRKVLHIGCGRSDAPTLNLAVIRQRGASLGANEVHVYFLGKTDEQRNLVACDLRASLFGELCAQPTRASA